MFKNSKESRLIRPLEWEILEDGRNVCYGQPLLGAPIPALGLSLCPSLLKATYGCDRFPLRSKGKLGTQSSLIASPRPHYLIQRCLRLENQTSPDNFGNFRELCLSTRKAFTLFEGKNI